MNSNEKNKLLELAATPEMVKQREQSLRDILTKRDIDMMIKELDSFEKEWTFYDELD